MFYPKSFEKLPSGSSPLPNVSNVVRSYLQDVILQKRKITNIDYNNTITIDFEVVARAVVQPLTPQKLDIKPDGQRSYEWQQMHVPEEYLNNSVSTGDYISYEGKQYTIMNDLGYNHYGCKIFHISLLVNTVIS